MINASVDDTIDLVQPQAMKPPRSARYDVPPVEDVAGWHRHTKCDGRARGDANAPSIAAAAEWRLPRLTDFLS